MINKNIYRLLSMIFKKNKIYVIFSLVSVLIVTLLSLVSPLLTKQILDAGIMKNDYSTLIKFCIIFILVTFVIKVLSVFIDFIYVKIRTKTSTSLRTSIMRKLSRQSGDYLNKIKSGDTLHILNSDIHEVDSIGIDLVFKIITDVILALSSFIILIFIQIDLLILVLFLQIVTLIIQSKFSKKIEVNSEVLRDKTGELANTNQEYISNIVNVIISKSVPKFIKQYVYNQKNIVNGIIKLDFIFSSSMSISSMLSSLVYVAIYGYGGYKVIEGNLSIGELLAFQQYSGMLISPCISLVESNIQIQQSKASIGRIFNLLDEPITIVNNNKGIKLNNNFNGNIKFENVSFSYGDNLILKDINLEFENNSVTAIVGPSGCGKSTISRLIFRLWNPTSGYIEIDGNRIDKFSLKSLRKEISIVTQDTTLFDDTVYNNILLYKKDIDDKFMDICKCTGVIDLISQLPNGFDTIIGEKGVKLSGGQKQRISIARALFNESRVLVLDEATSSLDNISQREILKNIKPYLENKTVIVIAHRLSTIRDADFIYVMNNGYIEESGVHDNLVLNSNLYAELSIDEQQLATT